MNATRLEDGSAPRITVDPGRMRPWLNELGQPYVTVRNHAGVLVNEPYEETPGVGPARLTLEQWGAIDTTTSRAFAAAAPLTCDLIDRGLVYRELQPRRTGYPAEDLVPQALEYHVLDHKREVISPVSGLPMPAVVVYRLPLPAISKDFSVRGLSPGDEVDTTSAAASAGRVGRSVERMLLGFAEPFALQDGRVVGLCNHDGPRLNHTLRSCADGWEKKLTAWEERLRLAEARGDSAGAAGPEPMDLRAAKHDLISMSRILADRGYHSPQVLAHHPKDKRWGDNDLGVPTVSTPEVPYGKVVMFQATPAVVRMVVVMDPVTVQAGVVGKSICLSYACVVVPQVRADIHGNYGVVFGA